MSNTVRKLKQVPEPEADPEVVAQVEQLLEWAKSGQLQCFVLAGHVDLPGDPENSLYMKAGYVKALGVMVLALERAKLLLMGFREEDSWAKPV